MAHKFTLSLLAFSLSFSALSAQALDVTVAYQTSAEPAKVAQADDAFAKASGAKSGLAQV
jgi:taurine transport system substrate-binding protein